LKGADVQEKYFLLFYSFFFFFLLKTGFIGDVEVSVVSFVTMAGQQNLVLPLIVNPVEITRNREAVLNGFLAIQRFFRANIWSPLGANIYSLFVSGVAGAIWHLSDAQVLNNFPVFAPERWEEKDFLW
jgi:hypothetical protein